MLQIKTLVEKELLSLVPKKKWDKMKKGKVVSNTLKNVYHIRNSEYTATNKTWPLP